MSKIRYLDEEELIRQGVKALIDALGPVEAGRFLTLPRQRRMESVRRHRQWQAMLEQESFFEEVFSPPAGKA
jgi:hypothetical protein